MSDKEKTQIDQALLEKMEKLPEPLREKLLDQAQGAAMAIDLMKREKQENKLEETA